MKKKMIALLAGALMTLAANSAFAAFVSGNLELYRVVYDSTASSTFECLTDLGALSTLSTLSANTVVGGGNDAFTSLAGYSSAIASGAVMKISYFAFDASTSSLYATETGNSAAPTVAPLKWASAGSALRTVSNQYKSGTFASGSTQTSIITGGNGATNSFSKKENKNGSFGGYFGNSADWAFTAVPLATLASSQISTLYFFNGDAGATGTSILTLTTNAANGSTTVQAQQTPIPAAAWLLGSGLMGLFGLRRKARG